MSNNDLKLAALALLGLHLAVLVLGLMRQGRAAALWLSAADAALVLVLLAQHPAAFRPPVDGQVVAVAIFEVLVLAAAAMAWRGVRFAGGAVWAAFALHLLACGLATAFAFTFKITRLI
jgi:class 3 adenylate cyclase